MEPAEKVRALPGGLDGDRYRRGTGYYSPFDVCEVTFVAAEALDAIASEAGIDLSGGEHRRNVVTRGVDLSALLETRFSVGGAVFEGTRPRPPCRHVEQVAGLDGLMDALRDRGGICADVVEPGEFAVGDAVEVGEDLSFDGEGWPRPSRSGPRGHKTRNRTPGTPGMHGPSARDALDFAADDGSYPLYGVVLVGWLFGFTGVPDGVLYSLANLLPGYGFRALADLFALLFEVAGVALLVAGATALVYRASAAAP